MRDSKIVRERVSEWMTSRDKLFETNIGQEQASIQTN